LFLTVIVCLVLYILSGTRVHLQAWQLLDLAITPLEGLQLLGVW